MISSVSLRPIMKCGISLDGDPRKTRSAIAVVDGRCAIAVKSGAIVPVLAVAASTEWHSVHHASTR